MTVVVAMVRLASHRRVERMLIVMWHVVLQSPGVALGDQGRVMPLDHLTPEHHPLLPSPWARLEPRSH